MQIDKKTRKRIQALKDRLQNRRNQLASARRQNDDPQAIPMLVAEIDRIEAELRDLQLS